MSLSQQFKCDDKKERSGVPVTFAENADGSTPTFIVSRMSRSNPRYTKVLEAACRPYKRQIELGTLDNGASDRLMMGVFIDALLTGWENVLLSDVTGDEKAKGFADFNKENAVALFTRLPDLYDELQSAAKNAALFKDSTLESDAKNW